MKMVLKIAAGIVLGVVAVWVIRLVVLGVMLNQVNDTMQESFKNIQNNAMRQQEQFRQKQLQQQQERERQKVMVELRRLEMQEQAQKAQREAFMLEARKRAAFDRWWQSPEWCNGATNMKMIVQCGDLKSSKRAEFDRLLALGKLSLPQ